jgi:hypothetical protein
MQIMHVHRNSENSFVNLLLLLAPAVIFGLVIFSYLLLSRNPSVAQVTAKLNPNLGAAKDEYRVLGDQDSLDSPNNNSLK